MYMKSCFPLRHGDSNIRRALWVQANPVQPHVVLRPSPEQMYPEPNTDAHEYREARIKIAARQDESGSGLGPIRGVASVVILYGALWLLYEGAKWLWRLL
jgi:hypothetical protein